MDSGNKPPDATPDQEPDAPTVAGMETADTGATAPMSAGVQSFAQTFVGKTLGDYEVIREVGRGSMGIVFEARNVRLDRTVALKVLPPSLSVTETVIKRFLREAQSVAKLDHESIVRIYDIGDQDGVFFYSMQLIEGMPMDKAVRERKFSPQESAKIMAQAARALFFAHENGIIHRDIKPANIILSYKDRPVLTDFGLARPEKAATLTESGALVGTPIYMSPEQVQGDRALIGRRTDIYSLGITFYEMLTGKTPFEASSTQEILKKIESHEPRSIRKLNPEIPKDLETICQKAFQKSPDDRYQTAIEFALDLERFLAQEPIQARRMPIHMRAFKRMGQHKEITILVVLVVIIGTAWLFTNYQNRRDSLDREAKQYAQHLVSGAKLALRKDWEGALENYVSAVSIDPMQATPYLERGKCRYMLQNYPEALADFDKAVELEGDNQHAILWRGIVKWNHGDETARGEGLVDIQETLSSTPDDPEVLLQAARLCLELVRSTERISAQDQFMKAGYDRISALLDQNSENDDAHLLQGMYYEEQGLLELALQSYDRAIEFNPQNTTAWTLRHADRSEPVANQGSGGDETPTTTPTNADVLGLALVSGATWVKEQEFSLDTDTINSALGAFTGWNRGNSEDTESIEELLAEARRLWSSENAELAIPVYEKVLVLNPREAQPNIRLAEYYRQQKQLKRARRYIDTAREVAPANPETLMVAIQIYSELEDEPAVRSVVEDIRQHHPAVLNLPVLSNILDSLAPEKKGESGEEESSAGT